MQQVARQACPEGVCEIEEWDFGTWRAPTAVHRRWCLLLRCVGGGSERGDPVLLDDIARAMTCLVPGDIEVLAGLEMDGIPVVTALGRHTGLPCAFVP